ncbi:hypothetical protein A1332_05355 [Methylomonas methanica]|uniref:Uncharacterized protein n=1 Tax=Methylomonas methanica TaxID=421 RepID=A0A177LR00_METMH|nr:hypothetical protein A1332_05355 [Methylomonas methanica]
MWATIIHIGHPADSIGPECRVNKNHVTFKIASIYSLGTYSRKPRSQKSRVLFPALIVQLIIWSIFAN